MLCKRSQQFRRKETIVVVLAPLVRLNCSVQEPPLEDAPAVLFEHQSIRFAFYTLDFVLQPEKVTLSCLLS